MLNMNLSTLNRWFSYIYSKRKDVENLAGHIARQSRANLIQQIICHTRALPPEQVKGYARAYSPGCLEPHIKQWIACNRPNNALISAVTSKSREQLIEMVVQDIQTTSPPVVITDVAAAA
jgi:hypothetical protein